VLRAAGRSSDSMPAPQVTIPEAHLGDYLRVVYKRRWVAATTLFLVVVAVVIYTFTVTPIYEAHAQLLIEVENPNVVSFKEVIEQDKATTDYYQTQYRILQSRTLARRTLSKLNLWSQFQPVPEAAQGFSIHTLVAGSVGYVTQLFTSAPKIEPRADSETTIQSKAIDKFLLNLTVTPIRNSRLVDVKFASPNPDVTAAVANATTAMYIEQSLEFKYTSSREASDWLGQRLGEQRKQVESTEAALQHYREQNDALSLEERQNIVVQKLADLNGAVTRAKTERIQKEAAYGQLKMIQSDRTALDTVPSILANQFVQQQKSELADLQRQQAQLSDKLGEKHPDMVKNRHAIQTAEAKIQGEIAKVVESVKHDYQTALAQEQSLMHALDQQKEDALALNRKGIGYGALQRDAASNRQIFEALMQRTKETGISGALKSSNVRVVDIAETPQKPASPNKLLNLMIALVGGSALALTLVFFFEYADNRIKSPNEIKAHLGLPFLGMIPGVTDEIEGTPLLDNGVNAGFAEAFRMVRTNLVFSSVDAGSQTICITSSGPGEGKTLVGSNIAVALGQTGQRVLLIDADMRRPRVHEVFEMPQEPGLSNLLVGDTKTADAVKQTRSKGLWVLPAGRIPPNPAELLGSTRFKDFVTTVSQHFDWVVIDSPPVMAVADAAVIANIVSGVVFVVGAEMTSRTVARTAVEQLANARGRLIGAVLNRVDLDNNAYYYSQYYRRQYGEYYTSTSASA
jgi:capsular exopolysaccharide synthesis family protein